MPIIFGLSLYLLRTPIQTGKFLSGFGPVLSMVFPAEDLYYPLAESPLVPEKNTYNFNLSHKYLGRHAVSVEIPSDTSPASSMNHPVENTISVKVRIKNGDNELFSGSEDRAWPYWGKGNYGFYYVIYNVPQNVPVSKNISVEIIIEKDLTEFLQKHENAKLVVKKFSDQ